MRKWLVVSVLALAGLSGSAGRASAWWHYGIWVQPYYTPVAFPMLTPSGYFSNSYYFPWYFPWYANYNYSNGYYSNWWLGGGYASYAGQQMPPVVVQANNVNINVVEKDGKKIVPKKLVPGAPLRAPAKVSISLPADAKLLFNGVLAEGNGEKRSFVTPALNPDQDYQYVLTAELLRDGQVIALTERVVVRAGETTSVNLNPADLAKK